MDNKLRNLLLDNYEKSLPSKRDTEDFIINFHQYRAKKKAQQKTHYGLVFACFLILTMIGSIVMKQNKNNLDIQTAAGVEKCNTQLMEKK
jgi:hypothetical protein